MIGFSADAAKRDSRSPGSISPLSATMGVPSSATSADSWSGLFPTCPKGASCPSFAATSCPSIADKVSAVATSGFCGSPLPACVPRGFMPLPILPLFFLPIADTSLSKIYTQTALHGNRSDCPLYGTLFSIDCWRKYPGCAISVTPFTYGHVRFSLHPNVVQGSGYRNEWNFFWKSPVVCPRL